MSAPLLSVIVPVYNVEPYLRKCLDSLITQTLRDIEIICVNDGSTDGCPAILDAYAARDSRITVIHQENKGTSIARNIGMAAARAGLISFIDSDDWVEPNTCEKCLAYMEPDVDLLVFGMKMDGDKKAVKRFLPYFKPRFFGNVALTEEVMMRADTCVCNKIFRRSLIEKHSLHFPEGLRYEDNFFFQAYGSVARKAYFLAVPLYHYVCRSGSFMNQTQQGNRRHSEDGLRIVEQLGRFWRECGELPQRRHQLGMLFQRLAHPLFADLQHATADQRSERLRMLIRFAEDWELEQHPDIAYTVQLFRQNKWPGMRRKRFGGLIRIKEGVNGRKISCCGITVWRERIPTPAQGNACSNRHYINTDL